MYFVGIVLQCLSEQDSYVEATAVCADHLLRTYVKAYATTVIHEDS